MDDFYKIISTRRSIRKFDSRNVSNDILKNIASLGSLAPSRMNMQPWQFILVTDDQISKDVFENILWGSKNPANKIFSNVDFAPAAYIAILIDEKIAKAKYEYELGACAENMMIYAWSLGIGSVWLHSINRENITKILKIPAGIKLDSIVALGYPDHKSNVVALADSYIYSVDDSTDLIVPKRDVSKLTFENIYGNN